MSTAAILRIKAAADEFAAEIMSYSGRFMYGQECIAVALDDRGDTRPFIDRANVRGAHTDSLGRGAVVYWPGIPYTEEDPK